MASGTPLLLCRGPMADGTLLLLLRRPLASRRRIEGAAVAPVTDGTPLLCRPLLAGGDVLKPCRGPVASGTLLLLLLRPRGCRA
jgi:hypothetical protein